MRSFPLICALIFDSTIQRQRRHGFCRCPCMKKLIITLCILHVALSTTATTYFGRVVDEQFNGIGYATVYPIDNPMLGTATNNDGYFSFEASLPELSHVVVSFIGYEKQQMSLSVFAGPDTAIIVLHEQPIALEQTVVTAKLPKYGNKRKQKAALIHRAYVQIVKDFPDKPYRSRIVSDVRMDSEGEAWGMEQMVATVVNLPGEGKQKDVDSVQFGAEYCKRFFKPEIRERANNLYVGDAIDKVNKRIRHAAGSIDSGIIVHKALWQAGNILALFEMNMNDLKNWSVTNESDGETVLTYRQHKNYVGIFKYNFEHHLILDSKTLSVRRFSETGYVEVNIPFGKKLDSNQLQLLNLLNMGNEEISKFRLRHLKSKMTMNTIYQRRDNKLYVLEKNLRMDAQIQGTKKKEIPLKLNATQRVVDLQTHNVQFLNKSQMPKRIQREIVEIY